MVVVNIGDFVQVSNKEFNQLKGFFFFNFREQIEEYRNVS